jgi:hypothetical protein
MIKKIYVCSKGKPQTMRIAETFKRDKFKDYVVILSPEDDQIAYKQNYGCAVLISPAKNLSAKKEWIIKTQSTRGEWVLIVEDNITSFTGWLSSAPPKDLKLLKKQITTQQFLKVVNEDVKKAEKSGAVIGGFASNNNPFFRKKKYREVGFIWGKAVYYRNVGLQWLNHLNEMSDYAITGLSLLHSGKVVINNFIYPESKRFEKVGGTGGYEKRVPHKQAAAKFLVEFFKGLYRITDRPGLAPNSEVRMRFSTTKQINQWRNTM